jgi:pyruvate/2-oxoglutarate dehydrogenase complex dihydrolipoamide dehydrogenase (E3) component
MTAPIASLPIAVIGAGPVGLAAAAHLTERALPFVVLEASAGVAASFASVAHVRLFSPWEHDVDPAAARLLAAQGWQAPPPRELPTAGAIRERYLEPLARLVASSVRYGTRVVAISRAGFDKVRSTGREHAPFAIEVDIDGRRETIHARAVIDATGTWATPNPLGGNGVAADGEAALSHRIVYGMPDVLGRDRERYAGKRVLVVGAGHSAAGSLIALAELARAVPGTSFVWVVRGDNPSRVFGGGAKDGLPARGQLGTTLRELIAAGQLELRTGVSIHALRERAGSIEVVGQTVSGEPVALAGIDQIIAATGSRPDLSMTRELRVRLDPWIESTDALAPLIDPNVHSCGSVPPHGHRELEHPERGYYAVGAKSYGRAPNFLLATGYEQVRSVVAAIAGDLAAADAVQLVLPETGVCSSDLGAGAPAAASACCPTSEPVATPAPAASGCCGPNPAAAAPKATGCCG